MDSNPLTSTSTLINKNNKNESLKSNESESTSKKLMEAWLSFCKNFNNKSSQEAQGVLKNISDLLDDLITRGVFNQASIDFESDSVKFFISSFTPELIKNLLNSTHKDRLIRELVSRILENYLQIFAENIHNVKLIPMFRSFVEIFDQEKAFYKSLDGKDASETYLDGIYHLLNKNDTNWREGLTLGDQVDYLLKDNLSEIKTIPLCCSWTRGEIVSLGTDSSDTISLRLFGTGGRINNISRSSNNILPVGTFSDDYEWRENLAEGDEIDFLDLKSWYRSTVVDTAERIENKFEEKNLSTNYNCFKNIKYGLRIYRPNGRLSDKKGRKYFGWSEEYDKYISVHDPRIRKPNEFSKIIYNYHLISLYPIEGRKFNETENFIPFDSNGNKFYIIPRKTEYRNIDAVYYTILNRFSYQFNGLNKILTELENFSHEDMSKDAFYFDSFNLFIEIIYSINNFVHIKFFSEYFKTFLKISFEILKKFSKIESSNFRRDALESSLKKLKDIMSRVYIETDVNLIYDTFIVEFGLNLFKHSKILQKRILGLKLLSDVLNDVLKSSSLITNTDKHYMIPYLSAKVLYTDNEGKDIFDYLYDSQTHSEILQKSPEFLKALFSGRVLTTNNIEKILSIRQKTNDREIQSVIHKGLLENVGQLGNDLQNFFMQRLIEIPADKLTRNDIELLLTTSYKFNFNSCIKDGKLTTKEISDFFSNLILNKFEILKKNQLYQYVIEEWISLMKSNEMRVYVADFVCNIIYAMKGEEIDFIRGLNLIAKLVNSVYYLLDDAQGDKLVGLLLGSPNITEAKNFYECENNMIGICLNFLKVYHTNVKDFLHKEILIKNEKNNKVVSRDIENLVFKTSDIIANHTTHKDVVSAIINFLGLFHVVKNFSYSKNQINLLYKFLVEDSLSIQDTNIFFSWLKDTEDKSIVPKETFHEIFVHMIENKNLQFAHISLDLFDCMWNIFVTINKKLNKLGGVNENRIETTYGVSASGATLISRTYNPEKKCESDVKCLIENPNDLMGIELIWKLVLSCIHTSEVGKKATHNLLKLFLNNDLDSQKRGLLWNILIDRTMKTIQKVKELYEEKEITKIEKRIKIINCLHIIKSLIEETEKKGTAGSISHSSILKHSAINLKITNSISGRIPQAKEEDGSNNNNKTFDLKLFANTTLWDLKKIICKHIRVIPECIKFVSTSLKEMTDTDHGKTLHELNFKTTESITIIKNSLLEQIPKEVLVKNGKLSEKLVHVFKEIFEIFSTDGYMSKEQSTRFIKVAIDSNEIITIDDSRVKGLFDAYDFDKDNLLEFDGFLQFYSESIIGMKKANTVWENLRSFNYRNDLKKLDEPLDGEYNLDVEVMPRYRIAKNSKYFNTIFELQEDDEVIASEASKLLSIISTNPGIFKEIWMLDMLGSNLENAKRFLDTSNPFKLFYSLQIVESFFEEIEIGNVAVHNEPYEIRLFEDESVTSGLFNRKIEWIERFLCGRGINHIIENILSEVKEDAYTPSLSNNRKIDKKFNSHFKFYLNLSLKIVKTSLSVLFRARNKQNSKDSAIKRLRKESFSQENFSFLEEKAYDVLNANEYIPNENIFEPNSKTSDKQDTQIDGKLPGNCLENKNDKENLLEAELIDIIYSKYGDSLLQKINFESLAHRLMSITFEINTDADYNVRSVYNNSTNLLSLIIVSQDDITLFLNSGIYSYKNKFDYKLVDGTTQQIEMNFEKFILHNLLSPCLWVRSSFKTNIKNLFLNLINLKEFSLTDKILELCIQKLAFLDVKEKSQCSYFFEIFILLLENYLIKEISTDGDYLNLSPKKIDCNNLSLQIINNLKIPSQPDEEALYIGYLNILSIIIKSRENDKEFKAYLGCELNLIDVLLDNYLISQNEFNYISPHEYEKDNSHELIDPNSEKIQLSLRRPPFNSPDGKKSIFNLLQILLSENSQNALKLFKNINFTNSSMFLTSLKYDKKSYNPNMEKRSHNGYSGIKNLSAICYMISIIQQFFHLPILRYAIMQANDGKSPTYTENNTSIDDNLLHQLQRMFVNMELTNKNEVLPTDFCYAFKGPDGQPTNVSQHQDTSEFLGKLFDILESSLKNSEYQYILQSNFLGKICSQLVCKTCNSIRDNFEDFYSLSLEVKNLQTLSQSMEKFISEDLISDYFCSNCKKNVSVIKRASFAQLPNVILMNLQRIQFNLDTMTNEKINSRLEFPKRINLKPYCTETLNHDEKFNHEGEFYERIYQRDESYYEYELVGVVVHMGTADWGHYYSTINVKRDGTGEKMNFNPKNDIHVKKWLTFNDSSVTSFLMKNFEEECYGGANSKKKDEKETENLWGIKTQKSNDNEGENNKNAYVLVYERITKDPLMMRLNKTIDEVDMSKVVAYDNESKYKIMKLYDVFAPKQTVAECNVTSNMDEESVRMSIGVKCSDLLDTAYDKISLDCENTAVSRVDKKSNSILSLNWDNSAQLDRGRNIYNTLFYDEIKKEIVYYIPYYSLSSLIPAKYFREVSGDNMKFVNDQKVYSKQFSEFLENLSLNVKNILLDEKELSKLAISSEMKIKIYSTLVTFTFDVLSKSEFRENLSKIVENLIEIINIDPDLSEIIINHLFSFRSTLIKDMIFSSEESSNSAYKNLLVKSILANFNLHYLEIQSILDNNELIIDSSAENRNVLNFLDYIYSLLPTEASKSWTKICTYLEIFESLVQSNHELVLNYMFKKETVFRLVDFMLGKESPYYIKGEARTEMGNKSILPKFAPLIGTISALGRHCYTEAWTEENRSESPQTLLLSSRIYNLSDKDYKCITSKIFYTKAIKDGYNNAALSKLLAHLMYMNYSFSRKRVYMILQSINEASSASEAKDCLDLLFNVISLYDKYSLQRLEWIFGIPQLHIKTSVWDYPLLPDRSTKYGEKIVKYSSPIAYQTSYESLTERIITKFQASVEFINILNYLFALVLKKPHVFAYFDSLPHPRKDMMLLKDYLFSLASEEIERILNVSNSGSKFEAGITGMTKIMEIYDQQKIKNREEIIENNLVPFSLNMPLAFSAKYKYGDIVREHITNYPDEIINKLNVFCFQIDYDVEILREGLDIEHEIEIEPVKEKETDEIAEKSDYMFKINIYPNSTANKSECVNLPKDILFENKEDHIVIEQQAITQEKGIKEYNESDEDDDKLSNEANNGDDLYKDNEYTKAELQKEFINLDLGSICNKKAYSEIQQKSEDNEYNTTRSVFHNVYNDFNHQKTSNEETFFKDNLNKIINYEIYTRVLANRTGNKTDRITVSAIKRFVMYNNSDSEYRLRFRFGSNDDFVNTYIPASELIVCTKRNSLGSVYTFTKEEINLPWNEISLEISLASEGDNLDRENESGSSNEKIIKKSNSYDNLRSKDAVMRKSF